MTSFPKGRCPAWKNGMRCRLEFAHIEDHHAHKDGVTWTPEETDSRSYTMDFGVNVLADPATDRVTKDYSQ